MIKKVAIGIIYDAYLIGTDRGSCFRLWNSPLYHGIWRVSHGERRDMSFPWNRLRYQLTMMFLDCTAMLQHDFALYHQELYKCILLCAMCDILTLDRAVPCRYLL
jgi:hypothetical protein